MQLRAMIEHVFVEHDGRYGYRRIHAVLIRRGFACSPDLVRSLMREAGLVACQPRRARMRTTRADEQAAPIPDLVGRDFTADAPGKVFVGDITYVPTWEGWLYVALVIDCYSRCIAGWAMDDNYKTPLIVEAVTMAARNIPPISEAVFHSDRGSNYTSDEYGSALEDLGLLRSVGRTGICFDNALAESTNGALKVELVNRTQYATRAAAKKDIARYIELFYNRRRLHSGLAYQTPRKSSTDTGQVQQQRKKANYRVRKTTSSSNTRLHSYCGDIPPTKSEHAYYAELTTASATASPAEPALH